MPALVPIILEALPSIVTGAEHLIAYINSVRTSLQQTGEWTADHEAQFLAGLAAHSTDTAYIPHHD